MLKRKGKSSRTKQKRVLRLEGLESRQLLAANILATTEVGGQQVVQEYESTGALVSQMDVESGGVTEKARDLVVDSDGQLHVYNGTNNPYLSTYDAGTDSWSHLTMAGWSTFSSSYNGGLDVYQNFAFATDMWGGGSASPKGIVRFDLDTGASTRFDNWYSYTDLTVGQDGLLYALQSRTVRVYDPTSLALQNTIQLPFSVNGQSQIYRAISVDGDGDIIAASWKNQIHRFDSGGALQDSTTITPPSSFFGDFTDLDLSDDGRLVLGTYWGYIVQMKDDFSDVSFIDTGNKSVFVAFASSGTTSTPTVSVSDAVVIEGDTGTSSATFNVTLSAPSTTSVSIQYATSGLTAASGTDFVSTAGTLVFAPGETSHALSIEVIGDTADEDDETFALTLSNPLGAIIGDGQGVATIIDDDTTVLPSVVVSNTMANESDSTADFLLTLSAASSSAVTIDYSTRDSSATAGLDYLYTSGTAVFATGETSKTISIPIIDDVADEYPESFYLDLTGAQGATIADNQGHASLFDNDRAEVSVSDVSVDEGDSGTTSANFSVSLSGPSSFTVRVDYATVEQTGTAGTDYQSVSGTLVFAPGEINKTVSVPVIGDTDVEGDEVFELVLSSPVSADLGDDVGLATIIDDDITPLTLTIQHDSAFEGYDDELAFTVLLSESSTDTVSVSYATGVTPGSAVAGEDYIATSGIVTFQPGETSKTVLVPILDDDIDEYTESFNFDIYSPVNAMISQSSDRGFIYDNDAAVLSVSEPTIDEGDAGVQMANFAITLSNPVHRDVQVNYSTRDFSATAGVDYGAVSGTVTFLAGETQKTVSVPVYGDDLYEANELIYFDADANINYVLHDVTVFGTIADDDRPTITVEDAQIIEGDNGSLQMVFVVTMSNPSSVQAGVSYDTLSGTATEGVDFAATSGLVVFAPLQTTQTITVDIYGDVLQESDEYLRLHLYQPLSADLLDTLAIGTIVDND